MPEQNIGRKKTLLWVIPIGLLLLLVTSFLFHFTRPKPITSAEQRLLGTWRRASDGTRFLNFQPDRTFVRTDSVQSKGASPSTVHARWYVDGSELRFQADGERWNAIRIISVTEQALKIGNNPDTPVVYARSKEASTRAPRSKRE